MVEENLSSYELVPELGDQISIVSTVHKLTTGRIIFRDENVIRIRPQNSSHRAVDFPVDPLTGEFQDSLGVTEIVIHEKRKTPHFSKQLCTVIGEYLDFFHSDGTPADPSGIVFKIIATEDHDAIQLEDGRVLDFGFIGSPPPNDVIRPRAAPEDEVSLENNSDGTILDEPEQEFFPEIDFSTLPVALVEEVPTQERTYSDSVQREDMFVSMLVDVPLKRQKDPKVMQELYRLTDILLALKNSVLQRDNYGNILPTSRSYVANTLLESIAHQPTGNALGALMPVVSVKKVLYTDDDPAEIRTFEDIDIQSDLGSLIRTSQTDEFNRRGQTNSFVAYIHKVLQSTASYVPKSEERTPIRVDQDVFCSQFPYESMEGLMKISGGVIPGIEENEKDRKRRWFEEKKEFKRKLTSERVGRIENRYARLLSASTIRNSKTNAVFTVAPADAGERLGYVLLSEALTSYRVPIRSKVLIWDIAHSNLSRKRPSLFHEILVETPEEQIILQLNDTTQITDVVTQRLLPTTSFVNYATSQLYDTLGMQDLEYTESLLRPFDSSLKVGCTLWNSAQKERNERFEIASKQTSLPPIAPIVADFSTHLALTESHPTFQDTFKRLTQKESTFEKYDLSIYNELSIAGGHTFERYWNAILAEQDKTVIERAEKTYLAETLREEQRRLRTEIAVRDFAATPDINRCPHVHELGRIYSIRNDEQRMMLFEKCFRKYQSGQKGNYILCGECGKDFVCKHEVLLLNEFLHPGRGVSLHKSLLLDFAGPVFEGAYICKTCGQKIKDIEYDTHLEFDDEGRPLVGRNVIEISEEDAEDKKVDDETDLALVIRSDVVDALPFTEEQMAVYHMVRTIGEQCGLTFPMDVYKRIVEGYMELFSKLSSKETYEKKRATALAAPKKKGFVPPQPYEEYVATFKVSTLSALVILELQTSSVVPPVATGECVFSRDGFPLESSGTGAIDYVTCIIANIMRNDKPWNQTIWSAETNMAKRLVMITNAVKGILDRIIGMDTYRDRLETERRKRQTAGVNGNTILRASDSDVLPPSFRPLQRIVLPSSLNEKPVANVRRFLGNVASGPITDMRTFIETRSEQIALHILNESHTMSQTTSSNPLPKRSEATCCFTKLRDVAKRGIGVLQLSKNEAQIAEYTLQISAQDSVERRDNTMPFSGTHIYVPWSAPLQTTIDPAADPSMYYKIFMKHCYKGIRYGHTHEFSINNVCRRCAFHYPDELNYPDQITLKKREELSLAALHTAGVVINEESFNRLDRQIKIMKTIVPSATRIDSNFLDELMTMKDMLDGIQSPGDMESLIATMQEIQSKGFKGITRRVQFSDVSQRYDTLRNRFSACFDDTGPAILETIDELTEKTIGSIGVRNLLQLFVVQGTQIEKHYLLGTPPFGKLFKNINPNHLQLLEKIWEKSETIVKTNVTNLTELEEDIQETVQAILNKFTNTYSLLFNKWIEEIRSNIHFTDDEYKIVLRWMTLSGLFALLSQDSFYYTEVPSMQTKQSTIAFFKKWIENSTKSYMTYIKRYQLTKIQIEEAIHARAELEKAQFIKKFDDLDKDLRAIEKIKKREKIGDWAVGTLKNLFTYDPDFYEFERSQRVAMGLPEFMPGEMGDTNMIPGMEERQRINEGAYENRVAADEDV